MYANLMQLAVSSARCARGAGDLGRRRSDCCAHHWTDHYGARSNVHLNVYWTGHCGDCVGLGPDSASSWGRVHPCETWPSRSGRMVFVDQDLMADDIFDIAQVLTLVLIAEGNRDAALTGSSSIIQGRLILSVVMSQYEVLVALEIFHGSHTR